MSAIQQDRDKLQYIFDNTKVGIAICNGENNLLEMLNPAFAKIYGYEPEEIIGASPSELFAPKCMIHLEENESAISCALSDVAFETTHIKKDGSPVNVSVHITVIKDENGTVQHRIANIQDISNRQEDETNCISKQQLIETKIQLSSLISTIPDMIWMKNEAGEYLSCNVAFERFIGAKESDILGKTDYDLIGEDSANLCKQSDIEAINSATICVSEETITYPDNNSLGVMEVRKAPIYNPDGTLIGVLGIARDITERKMIEKKIEFMAHHDALTGLPNRILAKDKTEQIIEQAKSSGKKAALLFIDLDGFKTINDSMGHTVGDHVLKIVASRFIDGIRENDIISRQGGDEFLLVLSDIQESGQIITIAQKLLKEFEKSFPIGNHLLSISASIGIAIYPENGETFEMLLQCADTAMYKAKESGKNGYCFYTQQMNHNLINQIKLQNDLKYALQNSELVLHYQPQIDLTNQLITGAEALIRWHHPQLGLISPMSFIPIAESSGLIVPIGEWVIKEACRQASQWHRDGKKITIAINISAVQFKRGNLETIITDALSASGLNPQFLELELTESIMMHDVDSTIQTVHNLKSLGIQLSIDDFGTGYSSLAYLKRFAVDKLKIDQSFVRDILRDKEDATIVKTIIQMAKSLNLKTIAEGVEDEHVLAIVDAYGCDEVQGYHFAKPMQTIDFEHYYKRFYKL